MGEYWRASAEGGQRAVRILDEEHLPRVRRLHPEADLELLRALPQEFSTRLAGPADTVAKELAKWNDTLSNALGPAKGLLARISKRNLPASMTSRWGRRPVSGGIRRERAKLAAQQAAR